MLEAAKLSHCLPITSEPAFSVMFGAAPFTAKQMEDSVHTEHMKVLVLHLGEKKKHVS